jgi:hypothetical protein
MKFTERLYLETKEAHTAVDQHPFIEKIKYHPIAVYLYMQLNKKIIYEIQQNIKLPDNLKNLIRDVNPVNDDDRYDFSTWKKLCKSHPLALAYQFYLGLLFGGNMLKKNMDNEHKDVLSFDNPKQLITDFKSYLDTNETLQTQDDQNEFISVVNQSYGLVVEYFEFSMHFF